ncbi:hypothetical protein ACTXT7_008245 [Hymenolepis weldensis]
MTWKGLAQWIALRNLTVKLQRKRLSLCAAMEGSLNSLALKLLLGQQIPRRIKKKAHKKYSYYFAVAVDLAQVG